MTVHGICDPQFAEVHEAFVRNFVEHGEVGAAVCLIHEGRTVVDLWGGVADASSGRPWGEETLVVVFSCSKGIVAICAHLLADRGLLDFTAPVTDYWPEFGRKGKASTSVGMLLNHQAGVPAFHQPVKAGAFYDWEYMVERLADEEPFWEPGTQVGYHSFNIGWLGGELVRRVDGRPIDRFVREELAESLGANFWFRLSVENEQLVAPQLPITDHFFLRTLREEPDSIAALQVRHSGGFVPGEEYNSPRAHRALLPAQGGITNARGLARLYAPFSLGGTMNGRRIVGPEAVQLMGTTSATTEHDLVLAKPYAYSYGFMKSGSWIKSATAFGHPGSGGSLGFADPAARLAFGYVMNQQTQDPQRRLALVDAAYAALGSTASHSALSM